MGNTWQIYAFFVYNHASVKKLIAHYCDSIHNREYHAQFLQS